jgi:serine/threonine protein kinase
MAEARTIPIAGAREATADESTATVRAEEVPPKGVPSSDSSSASAFPEIPRYTIVRQIGRGGMGVVYEAIGPLGVHVALKVIHPEKVGPTLLARFEQEARAMMELDHPDLIRIYDYGEYAGGPYFTMKLMAGRTLANVLSDLWHTPRTTLQLAARIARAVAFVHSRKKVHRDLKPTNILLNDRNEPTISDLGLIKETLDTGPPEPTTGPTFSRGYSSTLTQTGMRLGTEAYMSPEQAAGEHARIGPATDVWALGVMLHEMIWAQRPRLSDDGVVQFPDWPGMPLLSEPELVARVRPIVERCLVRDPEGRYPSAQELAEDLIAIIKSDELVAPETPRKNRWQWWLAAAAACLVGIVWLGVAALRDEPDSTQNGQLPESARNPFERERPIGVPVHLLRDDHQPVEYRVLAGAGRLNALPTELVLLSDEGQPLFVAIDHPPGPFEFSVECKAFGQTENSAGDLGVFFGWRENLPDPLAQMRYFALKLDTRPILNDAHGRVYFGTWQFNPSRKAAGMSESDLRHLLKMRSWIPLADPDKQGMDGWHRLRIAVVDQQFTIMVDSEPAQTLDVASIVRKDKFLQPMAVDCNGMLGLWVRNGTGHFRNATIMALTPPDR